MPGKPDSRTYLAFAATVVIGGANFIGVSFSNMELPPLFGAALRFGLGAVLLFAVARVGRLPVPTGRAAAGAVIYGLLGFGVAYACLYYALVGLAAGTAAVIVAAAPLFTLLIAALLGQERLTTRGLAGAVLAVAGIATLSADALGGDLSPSYVAAAVVGTVGAAASTVAAKSLPHVHPLDMNSIGMAAGTVLLAAISLLLDERWALPREPRTWAAIGWLVVLGSVALFQLFLYVIRRWTASATVYSLACMPVVAVALGALMLGEAITTQVLVGGALVMAAVYIGAIAGQGRFSAAADESAPSGSAAPESMRR